MLSNVLATWDINHNFSLSKQLRLKWKMVLLIKTKTFIYRLIFTLTKHPLCHSGQCCHYIETSPLVYVTNQWDGFYKMAALDWNRLILTTSFTYIIFSFLEETLFTQVSKKPSFHNFMFFWILIKLNCIYILICWKKIFYLENFSTENQQLTF